MKKTYTLIIVLLLIIGCGQQAAEKVDIEAARKSMLEADREFSKLSIQVGMHQSFGAFMTDNATHYVEDQHPVNGREAILALFPSGDEQRGSLVWEPTYADISESGDMGYTLGRWDYMTADSLGVESSVSYGYYVSIWKKQADGSWKYVFDTGVNGPKEEEDKGKESEE
jgi:ketosteroid isomerase-like protein